MPFPKNWVEELALEWVLLKGYLASSNVPLSSGRAGGKKEADVVGIRKGEDSLEIVHVETGTLAKKFEENLRSVREKFGPEQSEAIKLIFSESVAPGSIGGAFVSKAVVKRKDIFIAYYVPKKQAKKLKDELKKDGIEFLTLEEFIRMIPKDIEEWKERQKALGLTETTGITLSQGWWLLSLIDLINQIKNAEERSEK